MHKTYDSAEDEDEEEGLEEKEPEKAICPDTYQQ